MKFEGISRHRFFRPACSAVLTVLCGLALWKMPLGEPWVNASYDYTFRFGARAVTNKVVLILMDNNAHKELKVSRGEWSRKLHAELLDKLTAYRCPLIIFDIFFRTNASTGIDQHFAQLMRTHKKVVLMAEQAEVTLMAKQAEASRPGVRGVTPVYPAKLFLNASATNGVAWFDPDRDSIVRRHWPFETPGPEHYRSLAWVAADLAGASLPTAPQEQWLRYYGDGDKAPWSRLSYHYAEKQSSNYFHDKIVFIGSWPHTSLPGDEARDEFRTPYTRWTGESVGGVELHATAFLNLVNGEWLRRLPGWLEAITIVAFGALLGTSLSCYRTPIAAGLGLAFGLAATLGFVALSFATNYWFPWLVVAGGQVPCAFVCAVAAKRVARKVEELQPRKEAVPAAPAIALDYPDTPDYELFQPPFGEGAYGKVWLARNAIGQWQALKAIYKARFGLNVGPYDREFRGIERYKPISDKHPGLLRIDFISRKKDDGYFYYVMELGDSFTPGWEKDPRTYKPRDLASLRARADGKRLPVRECVRVVRALAEALDFLHQQGLTHRDIKPSNIIFVKDHPKLADVGLVTEMRTPSREVTYVGTPGYMPPPPELPGTVLADIYGLGMVLYVIATGCEPALFPEISTTLAGEMSAPDFIELNGVILKACQPDASQRYASAKDLGEALVAFERTLGEDLETLKVVPEEGIEPPTKGL